MNSEHLRIIADEVEALQDAYEGLKKEHLKLLLVLAAKQTRGDDMTYPYVTDEAKDRKDLYLTYPVGENGSRIEVLDKSLQPAVVELLTKEQP